MVKGDLLIGLKQQDLLVKKNPDEEEEEETIITDDLPLPNTIKAIKGDHIMQNHDACD